MTEQLFQFIWQLQYFNKDSLQTTTCESIQILHPGRLNTNQGPDFINAKIRIGATIWAGSVEVHLKSSDWHKHNHTSDKNYKNVILHVVYEDDDPASELLTLELQTRISRSLLKRYEELMLAQTFIPCEKIMHDVPPIVITNWKDRLIAERLERKSENIHEYLIQNKQHWEESFWWLLATNFGTKVNSEAFEAIAKSIPVSLLARHKNSLPQIEALLLGQANLLNEKFADPYAAMLQKEYRFLQTKYGLTSSGISVYFLRMRPGNFPTIRLAQLAALIQNSLHLFSKIISEPSLAKVKEWFAVNANDFWHYHYRLNDASVYKPKNIGASMIDNIIINTVVPILFTYGAVHQNQTLKDKAVQWLAETSPEQNRITKKLKIIGFENKHAMDSQSLIELKNHYCDLKKCLSCAVGNALLKRV